MKIGIDVMGGDFAPNSTIEGAILAHKEISADDTLVLIGDESIIKKVLAKNNANHSLFEIIHAPEVIEMGDHPAKAFSQKPKSSISIGFHLLHKGRIDGLASAGNTGAMMVGAMYTVKSVPGIIRPSITAAIPTEEGKPTILLDVGLNPDSKPDVLYQYAILGSIYTENVYNIKNPRIGLLSIGSEEEKGNLVTKATNELMKDSKDFNFIGNVEGNDFFTNKKADVVICDGFVGNVVLKEAESFYTLIKKRNIKDEFFEQFNFENTGGTPILGINAPVVIGHGISNEIAIKNMILHTKSVIKAKLSKKIKEAFN